MSSSATNPYLLTEFNEGQWTDYMWLVIVGALLAFFMAWAIGANDVANAFGTSVGSKSITLVQACIIAAFCEFGGAIALGGPVARTISGGIARPERFLDAPELFAFGMLGALFAAASWVTFATYMEVAVSTTHSIIGAVVGFALVWQGASAVVWNDKIDEFPYTRGIVAIVISWIVSPILAGVVAAALFVINRTCILRREKSATLAFWSLPVLVGVTVFINIFFVLYKGASKELKWDDKQAAWVAGVVTAGAIVFCFLVLLPLLRWKLRKDEEKREAQEQQAAQKAADAENGKPAELETQPSFFGTPDPNTFKGKAHKYMMRMKTALTHGVTVDIHAEEGQDEGVAAMHANAEVFDPKAEAVYAYLQVFSACCMSFAHGANDVANAIGPFSAIWYVFNNFKVSSNAESPKWILAMGGAGIVVGLATYGYNIIRALGIKLAKMTPSRGFCCELSAALTVSVASVFGLPISTTQCIVGAEMGVGLVEGVKHGANWKLFGKTACSWVLTLFVAGTISAAMFSWGVYAPSLTMSNKILYYEDFMSSMANNALKTVNATNFKLAPVVNATSATANGKVANSTADRIISATATNLKTLTDAKKTGYVNPYIMEQQVRQAMNVYEAATTVTIGYNKAAANFEPTEVQVPVAAKQ